MRTAPVLKVCAIICAFMLMSRVAWPQQAPGKQPGDADKQAMMQRWMEAATPGTAHKALDALVGKWQTTTTIWANGPAAPPAVTKGTAEYKWTLGGRFLQEDVQGEMMGKPYAGFGVIGYDNFNKKYTMFWVDNTSTADFTAEGDADQTGHVLTYYGKMDDPMTAEKGKPVKYVTRIIDADKHIFEIHDMSRTEPNTKMAELTFTRLK